MHSIYFFSHIPECNLSMSLTQTLNFCGTHGLNEELGEYIYYYRNRIVKLMLSTCDSISKEFISNPDGILKSDFHQKSSFDIAKYIFDQSMWVSNGILIMVFKHQDFFA